MPGPTLKRDLPAVLLDDPLRDGQAQAGSTGIATATGVGAVKPLEDVRHIFWRDANTRIAHQQLGAGLAVTQSNGNLPPGRRILERIVNEDQQQLCEAVFVTVDPNGFKRIEDECLTTSKLVGRTKGIEYYLVKVNEAMLERHASIGPRKRQQVSHQPGQTLGLSRHLGQCLFAFSLRHGFVTIEQFQVPLIAVSGARSSWEASETKRCCA